MASKNREILLVEDNPDDVDLRLLALSDHRLANRIHVVRDGVEALDFIFGTGSYTHRSSEDVPRVVLLDLKLPRVDELEVLRCIKEAQRIRSIPAVMHTSSQEEREVIES